MESTSGFPLPWIFAMVFSAPETFVVVKPGVGLSRGRREDFPIRPSHLAGRNGAVNDDMKGSTRDRIEKDNQKARVLDSVRGKSHVK